MKLIVYLIFLFLKRVIPLLPPGILRKTVKLKSYFFYYMLQIRKRTAGLNLKFAFPNLSGREISRIIRLSYYNILMTITEFFYMRKFTDDELRKQVKIVNIDLIKEKLRDNKGLILLSAHYGNWELTAYAVSRLCGVPFNIVVKQQSNRRLDREINLIRTSGGNKIIDMKNIREMIRCISGNGIVAMLGDQHTHSSHVTAVFFGHDVPFFEGAGRIASATGSPVLFGVSERQEDGTYYIYLHEIKANKSGISPNSDITLQYASLLEEYIRKNPSQWLWFHRRFKNYINY